MFLKIAAKYAYVFSIYIPLFVALMAVFSLTARDAADYTSEKLTISVTDNDNTPASRALVEYISSQNEILTVPDNKDAVLDSLFYRTVDIVVTIDKGYSDRLAKGETDNLISDYRVPDSYTAAFFDAQVNKFTSAASAYIAGGLDVSEASQRAAELSKESVEVELVSFSQEQSAGISNSVTSFWQYFCYIIISTLTMGLSPAILAIMSRNIRNRINCSPVPTSSQTSQVILGVTVISFAVFIIIAAVSFIMFGSEMFTPKGMYLLLNGFSFLLFCIVLTVFFAQVAGSVNTVNMMCTTISLLMCFLGGVFVPQQLLSDGVVTISRFFPTYWNVKAVNIIAQKGGEVFDAGNFFVCVLIQLAFSVALFLITLIIARNKRASSEA